MDGAMKTFTMKQPVEHGFDHLDQVGIIHSVSHSKWSSPVVWVLNGAVLHSKPNGLIRLCKYNKVTAKPELQADQYLLLRPNDLLANPAGGTKSPR